MYVKRDFFVAVILADPKFKHLETYHNKYGCCIRYDNFKKGNSIKPIINITEENEHVEEIERKIHIIKGYACSMIATTSCLGKFLEC